MLLLILYANQIFPNIELRKISIDCENDFYIKTLLTSLINSKVMVLLDDFEVDSIAILLKRSISDFFEGVLIRFKYYEPVYFQNDSSSTCNVLLYPLPYGSHDFALEVYDKNMIKCNNVSYDDDWDFIIISGLPKSNFSVSISVNLTDFLNTYSLGNSKNLDPYSIFVFDLNGYPLKVKKIYYDGTWLNLTFNNMYNDAVLLVLRIKNSSSYANLTYLAGRYEISATAFSTNYIYNSTSPGTYMSKFSWITLAIDRTCYRGNKIVVGLTYVGFWDLQKNFSIKNCASVKSANYSMFNFFRYVPDIKSILGFPAKNYHYGGSVTVPGLEYKKVEIYVAT